MINQRLVKLALPSDLVTTMDTYINATTSYSGRQNFIADAIANLLADLEVEGASADADLRPPPALLSVTSRTEIAADNQARESSSKRVEPLDRGTALALAEVAFASDDLLRTERIFPSPTEPTWGIHNRDFPTLWAAGLMSRELAESETIDYQRWLNETVEVAWRLAASLDGLDIDLSGFPMNVDKADKSESRFVRFFLGEEAGRGPLFDLGLAAEVEPGRVTLTLDGADLLAKLQGWAPLISEPPPAQIRDLFLHHLFWRVPADFELLRDIVDLIGRGADERYALIAEIGNRNPDWPKGVTATNVAGFIGRGRQWGLIERRQKNRRYELTAGAVDAIHRFDDQHTGELGA